MKSSFLGIFYNYVLGAGKRYDEIGRKGIWSYDWLYLGRRGLYPGYCGYDVELGHQGC